MGHTLKDVIESEKKYLQTRRTYLEEAKTPVEIKNDLIGIASSGGGVRSAVVNLGVLKILTESGILQKADYHSTVSGGGYAGAYIQGTVREEGKFEGLFQQDKEESLRKVAAKYLAPNGFIDQCRMYLAFFSYLIMNTVKWVIVLGILFCVVQSLGLLIRYSFGLLGFGGLWINAYPNASSIIGLTLFVLFCFQFLSISLTKYLSSFLLNILLSAILIFGLWIFLVISYKGQQLFPLQPKQYFLIIIALVAGWEILRPDLLSFGIYYEKKIADSYLKFAPYSQSLATPLTDFEAGKVGAKVSILRKMARRADHFFSKIPERLPDHNHFLAPYPLINSCLNLSGSSTVEMNENILSEDYFLLSPKFIGSVATGYSSADAEDYRNISLPTAIRISGAAVNAGMGTFSTPLRSLFITIFNASLGQWIRNPKVSELKFRWLIGPAFFLRDLTSQRGIDSPLVNISDGGHIENLGVFELLRRKCRLIICIDAGYDPHYSFEDLENLTKRSFSELGMEIKFREGQDPLQTIKPGLKGYSEESFAVADVYEWWDYLKPRANCNPEVPISTIIYIKSCLTRQYLLENKSQSKIRTWRKHKFPHTPTSDQFLEPDLWDSYYDLGQFLAKNMLNKIEGDSMKSRKELIDCFASVQDKKRYQVR